MDGTRQQCKGSKRKGGIRLRKSKQPGDGTSCDHIVSQQPGLTPQSHGKLTHARYWGSVLYCDDTSDYLYNHLVEGISSEATLESKLAYERVLASYDRKVKSYHADNLRFNDSNFTASCIKGGATNFVMWSGRSSPEWHSRSQSEIGQLRCKDIVTSR